MSEQPEFTAGPVDGPNDMSIYTAGINHNRAEASAGGVWWNRIEIHGHTKESAEELRDRVLAALDVPFTAEDIKLLEDLVSLGGSYAEEAVVSGLRSWHPFQTDKMRELASGGYGRAFEVLKQLKLMQEGRS